MLTKLFYIIILVIGLNFTSFSQSKGLPGEGPATAKLIKFYPNPATSVITFEVQKGYENNHSLQIFNFMGKPVFDLKRTPGRISVNLDDFFRGVYIFQLRDATGAIVQSGKFQVIK
jgi:hypothetical protein